MAGSVLFLFTILYAIGPCRTSAGTDYYLNQGKKFIPGIDRAQIGTVPHREFSGRQSRAVQRFDNLVRGIKG